MGLQLSRKSPILFNMKTCILLLALAVAVQAQKFEPANCDAEKEMMCSGKWNEDWTEQLTADFCIPMKNGDCYNYCPMDCGKDMVCPGGKDPQCLNLVVQENFALLIVTGQKKPCAWENGTR